jgi:CMP-N,N'-diacetyllegionaminic acid synthase
MILGTICARGGSKGIPHKNLKKLNGIPLIGRTLIQLTGFSCHVVSTDDFEIAEYATNAGYNVQMRPAELATDTASKWDVFRYIAECNPQYDILVDLDTGCPLRSGADITACIKKLMTGFDVVATAYEADRNPYFNMVESFGKNYQIVATMYSDPMGTECVVNRQDAPKVYSLSPSVFAIKREALFKYSHWSRSNMGIVEIPRKRAIDIDTPEDFEYVEFLMRNKNNG